MTRNVSFQPSLLREGIFLDYFYWLYFLNFGLKLDRFLFLGRFDWYFPIFALLAHLMRKSLVFTRITAIRTKIRLNCSAYLQLHVVWNKQYQANRDSPNISNQIGISHWLGAMLLKWSHSRWITMKFKIIMNVQYSRFTDKFHCARTCVVYENKSFQCYFLTQYFRKKCTSSSNSF